MLRAARGFIAASEEGGAKRILLVLLLFVLGAAVSYFHRDVAIAILIVLAAAINVKSSNCGFALAIFLAPIQSLFGLHDTDFTILRYSAIGLSALSFGFRHFDREIIFQPPAWILVGFGVLVGTHLLGEGEHEILRELGWYVGIVAIFFVGYHAGIGRLGNVLYAVYTTVLFSGVISAFYLYFGETWLIDQHVTLYAASRLSGVQYDPNVLSKIAAVAVVAAGLSLFSRISSNAILLALLSGVLYATGSKAGIGAALGVLATAAVWHSSRGLFASGRVWAALAIVFVSMASVHFITAHQTREVGHERLQTKNNDPVSELAAAVPELRIGHGYIMRKLKRPDGQIITTYKKVSGLLATGQRLRLWKAGFEVVRRHWLWGLGPKGLTLALNKRLHYPYTSPHNVILEMLGAYGILGLMLYFCLVVFIVWGCFKKLDSVATDVSSMMVIGALAVLMATEFVEPSLTFGYGVVSFWYWAFVGIFASYLQKHVASHAQTE